MSKSGNQTVVYSTTEVARSLGKNPHELLGELMGNGVISRDQKRRHYSASEFMIRAGLATSGDLKWTREGVRLLRKAFA